MLSTNDRTPIYWTRFLYTSLVCGEYCPILLYNVNWSVSRVSLVVTCRVSVVDFYYYYFYR